MTPAGVHSNVAGAGMRTAETAPPALCQRLSYSRWSPISAAPQYLWCATEHERADAAYFPQSSSRSIWCCCAPALNRQDRLCVRQSDVAQVLWTPINATWRPAKALSPPQVAARLMNARPMSTFAARGVKACVTADDTRRPKTNPFGHGDHNTPMSKCPESVSESRCVRNALSEVSDMINRYGTPPLPGWPPQLPARRRPELGSTSADMSHQGGDG